MKRSLGFSLTVLVFAAADAAEPASSSSAAATPTVATPTVAAPAPAIAPASPAVPEAKPAPTKPLDLRIGNVSRYMMPSEYRAALGAPDAEKNTVVVEAKRELLPVEFEKPIPTWPLGPLWWGLKNPSQSWRIFLPDINAPEDGPPDPVPPPIFRWGP